MYSFEVWSNQKLLWDGVGYRLGGVVRNFVSAMLQLQTSPSGDGFTFIVHKDV